VTLAALVLATASAGETPLLPRGATWRYLDDGVDPGANWSDPAFDDSAWEQGPAPLGYGLLLLGTTVDYGPDPLRRHPTTWFRTTFEVTDPAAYEAISLHLRRDDGAAVYVNGVEVARSNLLPGATALSYATTGIYGLDQEVFTPFLVPPGVLQPGTNVVAVELHNQSASSADLVVDLGVSGWDGPTSVTRGPWLQQTTTDGAIVRWNTDGPGAGQLWWGPNPGNLTQSLVDPTVGFSHALRITGVPANTDVTYAVGHPTAGVLVGDDADHTLHTAPVVGSRSPFRAWVLGDSGTANANAEAVREAWRTLHPDPLDTDVWLMLGDNAYASGRDSEYQTAVFDFYPEWLRQVSLWATLGNHDGYTAFSDTQTGPYFEVFTYPTAGELGGAPSGTEAYWSFDYGNAHFVNLDSYHSDRAPNAAMATWLEADLAASTADWNVVFFHHPPYSKGSHDSDREDEMVEMREFLNPILEDWGVDLVLTGHSHSYERSWLLDGHYGTSDTLTDDNILQHQLGDPAVDAPYTKWQVGTGVHDGAIYVVAGSSGQVSGGSLNHPAMAVSLAELGSLSLEFDGLELRGTFVDDTATVLDTFELHKGVTTLTDFGGDEIGIEGEVLSFHAAATQPSGAPVTDFRWDWGDGSPAGTGEAPTHAWATEGSYDVALTATDDLGRTATAGLRVEIDNGVPSIDRAEWSGVSLEGEVITFSASGSDPGLDPLTYTWTVDGRTLYGSTVQHTFLQDGSYVAHLDLADDSGRVVSTELGVTIGNAAPYLVSVTAHDVREGSPATLYALVDDPGLDFVTVEWHLPDRTSLGSTAIHTFPDDGVVPIELELRDSDGAVTTVQHEVVVQNVAPTVVAALTTVGGVEGAAIGFSAGTTDAGVDDVVEVRWRFGDGSRAAGDDVVHVFPDDGPWTVVATADDGDGGTTTSTLEVQLANVAPAISVVQVPGQVLEGSDTPLVVQATDAGTADVLSATWSLGDGRSVAGLDATARWLDEGTYEASVEVRDDDGGASRWPFVVSVGNVAPRFVSAPPVSRVDPGGTFTYDVVVDDVDPVTLVVVEPADAELEGTTLRYGASDAAGTSVPFRLRADDGDGGVTDQVFSLAIAGTSAAPPDRLGRADRPTRTGCSTAPSLGSASVALLAALSLRRRATARGGRR
jgi:PKD repeat protein